MSLPEEHAVGKVPTVKLGNAVNIILGNTFDRLDKDQLVTTFKGGAATILSPFTKMPLPLLHTLLPFVGTI